MFISKTEQGHKNEQSSPQDNMVNVSRITKTVTIVDDDSEFVEVIRLVLQGNESWEVVNTFSSLESFYQSLMPVIADSEALNNARDLLPDLLIVDIFASSGPANAAVPITGFQVALSLRDIGLQFGTLIISSMNSASLLRMLRDRHKDGWGYLIKSADLNSADILHAAQEALLP